MSQVRNKKFFRSALRIALPIFERPALWNSFIWFLPWIAPSFLGRRILFSIETGFKLKLSLVIFLMVSCRLLCRCCCCCCCCCWWWCLIFFGFLEFRRLVFCILCLGPAFYFPSLILLFSDSGDGGDVAGVNVSLALSRHRRFDLPASCVP